MKPTLINTNEQRPACHTRVLSALLCSQLSLAASGCIGKPQNPAATQPATVTDVATTQPSYWFDQPGTEAVVSTNLDALVAASEAAIRRFGFKVDRVDYRAALVTSQPLISSQFFEFWRNDVSSLEDSAEASARTTRRTIRMQINRTGEARFELVPKVLVERQTIAEQRITSVALYHGAFTRPNPQQRQRGSKETDEGIVIPSRYWYAQGRDPALEKKLADAVQAELSRK
jgi:hypothetical protein